MVIIASIWLREKKNKKSSIYLSFLDSLICIINVIAIKR